MTNMYSSDKDAIARVYEGFPAMIRLKQNYREYICPFHPILDRIPETPSELLDIGCGAGGFALSAMMNCNISSYTGIDIDIKSTQYAEKALRKAKELGFIENCVDVSFSNSIEKFQGKTFDIITLVDVLHHVKKNSLESFIGDILPMLKSSGCLIIKDMDTRSLSKMAMNQLHDLLLAREWIEHIPPKLLDSTLVEHFGLKLDESFNYDSLWYAHYLKVYRLSQ